ncbi:hypothetical protein ACHAW6_009164 [Cyclotella cf. meneghiniana]
MLKQWYTLAKDWGSKIYCGITLGWHYNKRYWISPCQCIFRKFLLVLAIPSPKNRNTIPTNLFPQNMAKQLKIFYPSMIPSIWI